MTAQRATDYATNFALDCLGTSESSALAPTDLPVDIRAGAKQADPSVWPVLDSVWRLYDTHRTQLDPHLDHVGLVYFGTAFPKRTAQQVIGGVARTGRVSPLAFIHANAGAALSICCTRFRFRGPTLNLTMSGTDAGRFADIAASTWLERGDARYLFVVAADADAHDRIVARAALYTRAARLAA